MSAMALPLIVFTVPVGSVSSTTMPGSKRVPRTVSVCGVLLFVTFAGEMDSMVGLFLFSCCAASVPTVSGNGRDTPPSVFDTTSE